MDAAPSRRDAAGSSAPSTPQERFLDRVLRQQRQVELDRERPSQGRLPAPGRARDDHVGDASTSRHADNGAPRQTSPRSIQTHGADARSRPTIQTLRRAENCHRRVKSIDPPAIEITCRARTSRARIGNAWTRVEPGEPKKPEALSRPTKPREAPIIGGASGRSTRRPSSSGSRERTRTSSSRGTTFDTFGWDAAS